MDEMEAAGQLRTSSAGSSLTDSAAAATAMATGYKTTNGVIGLDPDLNFLPTILEDALREGKSTGLVTTTQITHATPAAFAAHVEHRSLMTEIARQIVSAGVNVLLGGGEDYFFPSSETGCFPGSGKRDDNRNLIDEAVAVGGYDYVCDEASFDSADPAGTDRLIGLFADEGMPRPFSPSLAQMTRKAINILRKNENGFFLMVEGGQIDWASHRNDAANAIGDTVGLDEAVAVAKDMLSNTGDTLIIVTADHETGGMSVSLSSSGLADEDGPFLMPDGSPFYVNWSETNHTSADVPVTAQGPLAEDLNGLHENTYLHEVMLNMLVEH